MRSDRTPPIDPPPPDGADGREQPKDYEVGRGRPPRHSQFKSGGPGGPGRPKGSKNRATLFTEAFDSPRPVTVEGRRRRMTAQELGYRQLAMLVAKGDLRAINLAEQIRNGLCGPDSGPDAVVPPLSEAELAILGRMNND